MIPSKLLVALLFSVAAGCAGAAPVEFDTAAAHVIVVRPVDTWTGNKATAEYSLDDIRKKRVAFDYTDTDGKVWIGHKGDLPWSKDLADDDVLQQAYKAISERGFKLDGLDYIKVGPPVAVLPAEMPKIQAAQELLYKKLVISRGDPSALESKGETRRWVGAAIGLTVAKGASGKVGDVGATNFAFSSALTPDLVDLTGSAKKALFPVMPAGADFSGFWAVDVRNVVDSQKDRAGQIIIAWRGEKSAAAETEALAKAITTATGADSSIETVVDARLSDFQRQKAIWDACVAENKCKSD